SAGRPGHSQPGAADGARLDPGGHATGRDDPPGVHHARPADAAGGASSAKRSISIFPTGPDSARSGSLRLVAVARPAGPYAPRPTSPCTYVPANSSREAHL